MLTEPTIDKLRGMRLGTMADAWITQREQPKVHELDFDTRFGLLVDAEHLSRDNKRLARALRAAKLRLPNACIEDIDFAPKRELDRAAVRQLGTCSWIALHANVIITGARGTGKSCLACALAQQACRSGYRVAYRRMPLLIEEVLDDLEHVTPLLVAHAPRSSRANCPSKTGTTTSEIRQSPTRSSIASCTTHTGSN